MDLQEWLSVNKIQNHEKIFEELISIYKVETLEQLLASKMVINLLKSNMNAITKKTVR